MLEKIRDDLVADTGRRGLLAFLAALLLSPGFYTVFLHRLTASLYARGVVGRALGKLVWRIMVMTTGCHIHPQARIAGGLKLPHPVAIIVGMGAQIGAGVTLYQSVTIGVSKETDTYPTIGEGTKIFPGAVLVGPITIGARSTVGANAFVSIDSPEDALLVGAPARIVPRRGG